MKLLALDTACSACSAAVWADGAVAASRLQPMQRGHVETLLPMVQAVMSAAGLGFERLDAIAVTNGPGSFTGLRAGLAAARGLALARALPLVAVTTLEAVAFAAQQDRPDRSAAPILAAIETRRDDLYVQLFAAGLEPLDAPRAVSAAGAAACAGESGAVVAGDGAARVVAAWDAARGGTAPALAGTAGPDAAQVARLAAGRLEADGRPCTVAPLYLHAAEAKRPAAGGRLRP